MQSGKQLSFAFPLSDNKESVKQENNNKVETVKPYVFFRDSDLYKTVSHQQDAGRVKVLTPPKTQ